MLRSSWHTLYVFYYFKMFYSVYTPQYIYLFSIRTLRWWFYICNILELNIYLFLCSGAWGIEFSSSLEPDYQEKWKWDRLVTLVTLDSWCCVRFLKSSQARLFTGVFPCPLCRAMISPPWLDKSYRHIQKYVVCLTLVHVVESLISSHISFSHFNFPPIGSISLCPCLSLSLLRCLSLSSVSLSFCLPLSPSLLSLSSLQEREREKVLSSEDLQGVQDVSCIFL